MKTVSDRELRNFWRLILEVSDDRLNLLKTIYYVDRSCADVWSIPPFLSRPTYLWKSKYATNSWTRNSCWDDGWKIRFWKEMKMFRRWACQFQSDGINLRMNLMTIAPWKMAWQAIKNPIPFKRLGVSISLLCIIVCRFSVLWRETGQEGAINMSAKMKTLESKEWTVQRNKKDSRKMYVKKRLTALIEWRRQIFKPLILQIPNFEWLEMLKEEKTKNSRKRSTRAPMRWGRSSQKSCNSRTLLCWECEPMSWSKREWSTGGHRFWR